MDMRMHVNPYAVTIDEAPAYWEGDALWVLLASGEQTGGRYCLLWHRGPQGSGPGPHTHEQDEQVYVLEGELTFHTGNRLPVASAGSSLFIPHGTIHSFRVESETATILNFYTPAGFEHQVTQLGVPAETRTLPPKGLPPAVTDPRHILQILAQAGAHWVDEPDTLHPAREWGDPSQAGDLHRRQLLR